MDAVTQVPAPVNEPVRAYEAGSAELASLLNRAAELAASPLELTADRRTAATPAHRHPRHASELDRRRHPGRDRCGTSRRTGLGRALLR
jgi:hypothetical protein